jgi:hypothetical protein
VPVWLGDDVIMEDSTSWLCSSLGIYHPFTSMHTLKVGSDEGTPGPWPSGFVVSITDVHD